MAEDPYTLLGVPRTAGKNDINAAYRKLAKRYHPDLNPGDAEAEERFKAISAAYHFLSDDERRAQYDRGEIDSAGQPKGPERGFYRRYAEGDAGAKYSSSGGFRGSGGGFDGGFEDVGDIFSQFIRGAGGARAGGGIHARGEDARYTLTIDFLEAARGGRQRITLPTGDTLEVTIPAGVQDGQVLRLKGKGGPGLGKAPPGDALVEVSVRPHPQFERRGDDIHLDWPVSLGEAVLGGRIEVPTIHGRVAATVPKHANTGTTLRLRGRGIGPEGKRGDQFVHLRVMLPERPDAELERFVAEWSASHPYNPRGEREATS